MAECPRVVGGWGLRTPALGGGGGGRECRAGVRVRDAGWSAAVSVGRRRSLRPRRRRRLRFGAGVTRGGRPRGAVQGPGGPRGGSERKRCGCGLRWEPGRRPWGSQSFGEGFDPSLGCAGSGRSREVGGARAVASRALRTPAGRPELSDVAAGRDSLADFHAIPGPAELRAAPLPFLAARLPPPPSECGLLPPFPAGSSHSPSSLGITLGSLVAFSEISVRQMQRFR